MEYALIMPESKLYVRGFKNFVHAFHQWHAMDEQAREAWFIAKAAPLFPSNWLKFDEPCKWPAVRAGARNHLRVGRP